MNQPSTTKVLTKNVQNKFGYYFKKMSGHMGKPEVRFLYQMGIGLLKSQSSYINQIGIGLKEAIGLKKTTERLRRHYNKEGFWKKVILGHLKCVSTKVSDGDYMIIDLSDIQKEYSVAMEGLAPVKDGNSDKTGMGYWLMNIISINKEKVITPLYNKLYSFAKDTLSENNEIIMGIAIVREIIQKSVTWVMDRGADRPILIEYFLKNVLRFIIRLTKRRRLEYKGEELPVNEISKKVKLKYKLKAEKIKKNKIKTVIFLGGATKVRYNYKGEMVDLWLVVTKRENGGYAWFLTDSNKTDEMDVVTETFEAYGFRWKIELYHRHIKTQYHLEAIQIRKFEGLQTFLSALTIAMYLIYCEISSLHVMLIFKSGIKVWIKKTFKSMQNYIYYKIGLIIKELFKEVTPMSFLPEHSFYVKDRLQLSFNFPPD